MATSAEDAGAVPHVSGAMAAEGEVMTSTSAAVKDPAGPSVVPAIATLPGSPVQLDRTFDDVVANVRSAYVGRDSTVRLALCCLMAEGHLLVEDHPGVGKTTLAKALARSLDLTFGRVQFTADLLPSDVTGAMVFDRDTGRITFRPGPVFTNILLADELNRASPKAQSALLESMEEHQVSADGISYSLPQPFMVIATQNPYDAAGTFPLPHSQRDRFLLRLSLGYPERAAEDELLASTLDASRLPIRWRASAGSRSCAPSRPRSCTRTWRPRCAATSSISSGRPGPTPTSRWAHRPGPRWRCSGPPGRSRSPPAGTT